LKSKNSEPQTVQQLFQYALRLLTGRDYTIARLRSKLLTTHDCSGQDVEAIVDRLQEEGWLDDRRYAERFAESALAAGRFYGPRLRLEMRRRGLPIELVDEVMQRTQEEYDEVGELSSIIDHRFSDFVFSVAGDKEKRRVISWLLRRGFRLSAIMKVVRKSGGDTP
jgi:regulatory protein